MKSYSCPLLFVQSFDMGHHSKIVKSKWPQRPWWQADQTTSAVAKAIEAGYRLIDTAWYYQCEGAVGQGIAQTIKDGTVKREDLFVISKVSHLNTLL